MIFLLICKKLNPVMNIDYGFNKWGSNPYPTTYHLAGLSQPLVPLCKLGITAPTPQLIGG